MRTVLSTLAALLLLLVSPDVLRAQVQLPVGVLSLTAEELDWQDSPAGWQLADLYGDIRSNEYSVVRIKMRPNWDAPPYTHERTELEVLRVRSGTMYLTFGEDLTRAVAKAYGPGSFYCVPGWHDVAYVHERRRGHRRSDAFAGLQGERIGGGRGGAPVAVFGLQLNTAERISSRRKQHSYDFAEI
ncbi:MAG: hypothetical protein IH853_04960 [Bacteroidetes bacterium]|nr:hypothetical protein [Bacteroidota bacterium]